MFYDSIVILSFLLIASAFWLPIGFGHPLYVLYKGFLFLSIFLYFAWCWTRSGQTVGMRIWRFHLVCSDGSQIRWPQSVTRFVGAVFSFAIFGAGYLWILFNRQRKSWHDIVSGTCLVMDAEQPATHQ